MSEPIEIDDLGTIGVVSDMKPYQIPPEAWTTALNMRVVDGDLERMLGWEQTFGVVTAGNDSFTKVLMHFDGTDASTTFTDSNNPGLAHTWSAVDNAQLDTADKKFGLSSLLCDGVNDCITTPDSADFTLGSNDFTIDTWFKCTQVTGNFSHVAGQVDSLGTNANESFTLERHNTDKMSAKVGQGSSEFLIVGTTSFNNVTNTGWHHVAFVRTGNILKLFVDGVQEGGDLAFTGSVNDSSNLLGIGRRGEQTGFSWKGWIDEFRISIGIARWTSNFSPPGTRYTSVASASPHFAMPVRTASQTFWLYTSLVKAFNWNGTTHSDITRLSGDYTAGQTRDWNGTVLGGIPIINNGSDVPQYWSLPATATPLQDLTNWPANLRAKVVRAFGPFLLAIGITKAGVALPHMVKWSDSADPGTLPTSWDETDATGDAGEVELPDVDAGILVDMLPLSETMYLYKEASVWKGRYVGGRYIFDFGKGAWLTTTGILAPRCVCVTGDGTRHVWASQDDILWHDGNNVKSLLTEQRRRELFNSIDTVNYLNSFMFCNPLRGEIWFCYPPAGQTQPTKAFVFNYLRGGARWPITDADGITFRNAASGLIESPDLIHWDTDTGTWSTDDGPWAQIERRRVVLCGTDAMKFYKMDAGSTRDGVVFTGTLQRTGLSVLGKKKDGGWIVDFDRWKMWDVVWPKISGDQISARLGYQTLVDGPVTWYNAVNYNPASDIKVDVGPVSGRALAWEFSGSGAWRISGIKTNVADMGAF